MKKKALSLALVLASCLAMIAPSLADASTTGGNTAYLSLDPNTEIYAVTSAPGSDYPYYGAMYEPRNGVYYGRTCNINDRGDGRWVVMNESQMAEESIFSYYFDWNQPTSLRDCCEAYFGSLLQDNARALLIYFNFYGEANDFAPITSGQYDSQIRDMFTYMSTLKCPVFLRIGGEMNIWGNQAPPAAGFIAAYRHIADIGRSIAPNVALVFSPNYGSHTGVDMDSYYPGDAYVDWVGVSLYYDRYSTTGVTNMDQFFGVNTYGDALLNVQRVIHLAQLHNKPVMATEGGSANSFNGQDISAWSADRMARAYSFLPMVYPQIKAIISSDYHYSWEPSSYEFFTNPTVTAAYRQAVNGNPTYLKSTKDTASYYTRLSAYTGAWKGTMRLAAYSWAPDKLTASWYVDGQLKATATEYPYSFDLNTDELPSGGHAVTVTFSNGATKSYAFQTGGSQQPGQSGQTGQSAQAMPTNDKLTVDGKLQTPTVYKIDGSNYFKIRDLAAVLNGTGKEFEIGYDAAAKSVTATTGKGYTANGSELAGAAPGGEAAQISNDTIIINGVQAQGVTVYKIDGANYFKLRDLGKALDFYVGYESGIGMIVDSTKGYQD